MPSVRAKRDRIIEMATPILAPLNYEVVEIDIITERKGRLRVYIDHAGKSDQRIGIEDCVRATRALEPELDRSSLVDEFFKGQYELEVSSPGMDRPLRRAGDYARFSGQRARIQVTRPLTSEELENPGYHAKNPRQRNFEGVLQGLSEEKITLGLETPKRKSKKELGPAETLRIPFELIIKARLVPEY